MIDKEKEKEIAEKQGQIVLAKAKREIEAFVKAGIKPKESFASSRRETMYPHENDFKAESEASDEQIFNHLDDHTDEVQVTWKEPDRRTTAQKVLQHTVQKLLQPSGSGVRIGANLQESLTMEEIE